MNVRGLMAIAFFATIASFHGHVATAADCSQSASNESQADQDWWAVHGCQSTYVSWGTKVFHPRDWSGTGNGWEQACEENRNFSKWWSAAFLINYGLADSLYFSNVWHFTTDYTGLASGGDNSFHDSLVYLPPVDMNAFGRWRYVPFDDNEVEFGCALYEATTAANANPASRAGDFMHEGWHGYEDEFGYSVSGGCSGHLCTSGVCTTSSCDRWRYHTLSQYGNGPFAGGGRGSAPKLSVDATGGNPGHRPNQVQVEFLCDVNQYAASNVPASVRKAAKVDSNARAAMRFVNGPGYYCGDPRPW